MFNPKQFLDDFGINNTQQGKHARAGWVQIRCPFCSGHSGWHGGFNIRKGYYNCWRCGWHSLQDTIMKLLNCDFFSAKTYLAKYNDLPESPQNIGRPKIRHASKISYPSTCQPLGDLHKKYLQNRNFDPDELIIEWDLKGTSYIGDYKFRIIAPIYFQGQLVSYQGRDITGKQTAKYKACAIANETIHHKHILYGIDKAKGDSVIVVEGITDVWRLGSGSVATFGIEFTLSQVRLLKDRFQKFIIFFDNEGQAQIQADKLAALLSGFNRQVEMIDTESDPGELSPQEAKQLKKELLFA